MAEEDGVEAAAAVPVLVPVTAVPAPVQAEDADFFRTTGEFLFEKDSSAKT